MKRIKILIAVLLVAIVICCSVYILLQPMSKENVMKRYTEHDNAILTVAEYFALINSRSIIVWPSDEPFELIHIDNGRTFKITDEKIQVALRELILTGGCEVAGKEDNYIYFQFWSDRDNSRGIIYSTSFSTGIIEDKYSMYTLDETPYSNVFYYESEEV